MKRVCYFYAKYMDEKDDNRQEGVFHSLCDECAPLYQGLEEAPSFSDKGLRGQGSQVTGIVPHHLETGYIHNFIA